MRTLALIAPALAGVLIAGCTTPEQAARNAEIDRAELDRALRGRVAGTPQRCIPTSSSEGAQIAGDSILYRDGRRLWRSQVGANCPFLRDDQVVINIVYAGQLCENDRFRLLTRGTNIPSPDCRYGQFVPYTRPR